MEEIDLENIEHESAGFSGADISAMVKNAQIKAVHNLMEETKADPNKAKPKELILTKDLFDQAFQEIRKATDPRNEERALKRLIQTLLIRELICLGKSKLFTKFIESEIRRVC